MRKLIVFLCTTISLFACSNKSSTTDEAVKLYNESMAIHDEVMPRLGEMHRLEGTLKAMRDSLLTDSVANAERLGIVRKAITDLQDGSQGMMDWMHHIQDVPGSEPTMGHEDHDKPNEKLSQDDIIKAQKDQKTKIEQVKAVMLESITNAKKIIANKK